MGRRRSSTPNWVFRHCSAADFSYFRDRLESWRMRSSRPSKGEESRVRCPRAFPTNTRGRRYVTSRRRNRIEAASQRNLSGNALGTAAGSFTERFMKALISRQLVDYLEHRGVE